MTNTTEPNAIAAAYVKWRDAYNASTDAYAAVLSAVREYGQASPEHIAALHVYYPLSDKQAKLYKELKAAEAAAAKE